MGGCCCCCCFWCFFTDATIQANHPSICQPQNKTHFGTYLYFLGTHHENLHKLIVTSCLLVGLTCLMPSCSRKGRLLAGTEIPGVREEGDYLTLHCQHQNDSYFKMVSDESHVNVPLIVRDKFANTVPINSTFEKTEETRSRIEPKSFCLPD